MEMEIGITITPPAGHWTWSDSHNVAQYTNWQRGVTPWSGGDEPNGGTAENCVFLTVALDGYPGWSDFDCQQRYTEGYINHALCEI